MVRTGRWTRLAAALAAVTLAVALTGCAGGSTPPAAKPTGIAAGGVVTMKDFSFQPANIEVKVGTKVTWRNEDSSPHTVTEDEGAFTSPALDQGKTFEHTFDAKGTFKYHCSIHPSMVGQVVVK
jgi:plastocyanin